MEGLDEAFGVYGDDEFSSLAYFRADTNRASHLFDDHLADGKP